MPTLRSRRRLQSPSKLSPSPSPSPAPPPSPPLSTPPVPSSLLPLSEAAPTNPRYHFRQRPPSSAPLVKVHPSSSSCRKQRKPPLEPPQRGSHKRNKPSLVSPLPSSPSRKASTLAAENMDTVFLDDSSSDDEELQDYGNGDGFSGSRRRQGEGCSRVWYSDNGSGDVTMNGPIEYDGSYWCKLSVDLCGTSGATPSAAPSPSTESCLSMALQGQTSSGQAQQPLVPSSRHSMLHFAPPSRHHPSRLAQDNNHSALHLPPPSPLDLTKCQISSSQSAQQTPVLLAEQNGPVERFGQQSLVTGGPSTLQNGPVERSGQQSLVIGGPSTLPSQVQSLMRHRLAKELQNTEFLVRQQSQGDHSKQSSSSRSTPLEKSGQPAPVLGDPSSVLFPSGLPSSSSYVLATPADLNAPLEGSRWQVPAPGSSSSATFVSGQPSSSNGPTPLVGENAPGARPGRLEADRVRNLNIARKRAHHFAYYDGDGDEPPSAPPLSSRRQKTLPPPVPHPLREQGGEEEDWPGPFSTAQRLLKDRASAATAHKWATQLPPSSVPDFNWTPVKSRRRMVAPPMLSELCVRVLSENVQHIESLYGIPDASKVRISKALCARCQMSAEALALFFNHEPTEIRSSDCTKVSEEQLTQMMDRCNPSRLEIFELGNCGRCLTDECIITTFGKAPGYLSSLHTLSLRGNYRLSDRGLEAFVRATPLLETLDLSECSYISDSSMSIVADCAGGTLKSLCLDGCTQLNAASMLPFLSRMKGLQKLSLAQVDGVSDSVLSELMVHLGCNLMELSLAHCKALTDVAIAAIGACCPTLRSLKLDFLVLLTDAAIGSLVDGCRSLQTLSLTRCKFSDEAIAAYVSTSGSCICDFSLNSVREAGDLTLVALANHAKFNLRSLDASWCRQMNDKALGYLADACPNLHRLLLYGCTQVTDEFFLGHSNPNLEVIGLKL